MNGKGSKRRPPAIKHEQFAANWDAVFGKKPLPRPAIMQPQQKKS